MKWNSRAGLIAFAMLSAVSLVGCNVDEEESESSGYGYFRFANLVAGSPDIELTMDESAYAQIGFAEASSLEALDTGSYDLEFTQILPNTDKDSVIDDDSITIKSDYIYSYILYGDDVYAPEVLTIKTDVDDLYDDDYDDGQARLQFYQASSALAEVDVYLLDEGDDILNQAVYTSLSYHGESEEFDQDEGTYKIVIRQTTSDKVLIATDNITLAEANSYIYCLVSYALAGTDELRYGLVELDSDGARMMTNDAQSTIFRVNQAIANSNGVDVYIDAGSGKELIADELYMGDMSDGLLIDINDVDNGDDVAVYVYDAGSNVEMDSAVISDDYNIGPDSQITLTVAGDRDDALMMAEGEQDLTILATHGKLIFTHAIDDESNESLEIVVVEDGADPDNYNTALTLSYLTAVEYQIEQGDYDIYVYREDDGNWLADYSLSNLEEGDVVNLTITESQYGGSPYEVQKVLNN